MIAVVSYVVVIVVVVVVDDEYDYDDDVYIFHLMYWLSIIFYFTELTGIIVGVVVGTVVFVIAVPLIVMFARRRLCRENR